MENPKIDVAIEGRPYLAQRETSNNGAEGHISLFAPESGAEVGRVSMAIGGAMSLQTFGGALPRAEVEWLFATADRDLA